MNTLSISQTGNVAMARNQEAAKLAASITAGNILNDKVVAIIAPKLPPFAVGYANTDMGKAVIANVVASAITHFMPGNEKANLASTAMVNSAMLTFVGSFNIEEMVTELIDGVNLDALKESVVGGAE